VLACVLGSTHQLGESLVPVIIGAVVGNAVDHGSWGSIGWWLVVLAADFGFLSLSYRFGARASMRAQQGTGHAVRMWLTDRATDPAGGVRQPPGDLLSRASSDADRVGAYAGLLATAVAAVAALAVSVALLLWFSPPLGAIIVIAAAALVTAQRGVGGLLRRRSGVEQQRQARATALAEDLIRGLRVLRGVGAGPPAAAGYVQVSQQGADAAVHAVAAQALLTATGRLFTGAYLAVIAGVGGWLALSGRLGVGPLVAGLGLARFEIGPMQVLSEASAAYARALASAGRVLDVLSAEPAVGDGGGGLAAGAGEIVFDQVTLADGARLDAVVSAGAMTGLVCDDAVLAMTVAALLAREDDPPGGRILLDGADIAGLPLDGLRGALLVSPHDAVLMPGTIGDNLGLLGAGAVPVAEAARAAYADQVLDIVPGGLRAPTGDRGELLSGGQRQRVALARALAAGPPVLVLHDPTTAVDAVTEDRIARGVGALRAGRTTLVITTSPAWLARCAQVIYLGGGSAGGGGMLSGSHARLLATAAGYATAVAR
jgi:putative ABC transport system ATP-binding protein